MECAPDVNYCSSFIPPEGCSEDQISDCFERWNTELHSKYGYRAIKAEDVLPQNICDFYYIYHKWPQSDRVLLNAWITKIENATSKSNSINEVNSFELNIFSYIFDLLPIRKFVDSTIGLDIR